MASIIVKSGVPGKVPSALSLEFGQIAVNYADEKIYFKNSYGNIVSLTTATTSGTVTQVGGTGTVSGISLTGGVTSSGNLTLSGTLQVLPSNFQSQTAGTVLAAPALSAGVPTFRALLASDIPTLNQNTTGQAGQVAWQGITSKPTTLSGYGITDATPSSHIGIGGSAHANVIAGGDSGFMTGADKTKLDGIAVSANNYTHPANHPASIITQDSSNRFVTDAEKSTWNAKQQALGFTPENTSNKGVADGYASLDATGKVPSAQLPAYIDDVLEYTNLAQFPVTGTVGVIYLALDTNKAYRWSGSAYVYITSGAVDSVAGKTGVVTLVKADVGLSNVDNTQDANKPVSSAQQTALNLKANIASPVFTGNVTGLGVSTGTQFNGITGLASVAPLIAGTATAGTSTLVARQDHVHPVQVNITGNAATVTTNANLTGEVTSVGNATTVTNAAVIGKVLTGYVSGAGTLAATDTLLQAINKLNGNNELKANIASPVFTGNVTGLGVSTGTQFNGITGLASVAPLIAGTATVGTSTLAARQDHVHPVQVNITGSAGNLAVVSQVTDANTDRGTGQRVLLNTTGSLNFPSTTGITIEARRASGSQQAIGTVQLYSDSGTSTTDYYLRKVTGYSTQDTWQAWQKILHSGNFNTYSPTLTGTGAQGTWNISITGTATQVAWQGITSTPTTLSGYGITDAQTSLISGTNIKTINGQSILGQGNATFGSDRVYTEIVATASQTVFTVNYTPTNVDVYLNGVKLNISDYTATNGTSITITAGCDVGDVVAVSTYTNVALVSNKAAVFTVSSNTNAVLYNTYVFTGTSSTLTLPQVYAPGDWVEVINDQTNNTGCVIGRNGQKISGLSEDMVLNVVKRSFKLVYLNSTTGWLVF